MWDLLPASRYRFWVMSENLSDDVAVVVADERALAAQCLVHDDPKAENVCAVVDFAALGLLG